jgi:hypothetical protein
MEVVQIWSEAKALNGALDVLFDMGCRVGDAIVAIDAVEAALGSN